MKAMKGITVALALAGIVAASPAAAGWLCTAKNSAGTSYGGAGLYRAGAAGKAMSLCRSKSSNPASCVIVSCTQTAG